jgi:cytochrome b
MPKPPTSPAAPPLVLVWDVPTRLFHWLLVLLVATSWTTGKLGGDAWLQYHFWSGYAILTLVLFRIVWGVCGSTHARFASFVRGLPSALRHLRELARPGPTSDIGHNAIGGWMIVVLLGVLLLQTGTGLFADDDIVTTGPLGDLVSSDTRSRLTTIHKYNFDVILTLAGIHIAAVLAYWIVKRQNLIGAMITGRKRAPAANRGAGAIAGVIAHPALAAAVLVGAAAVVAGIVRLVPYFAR